MPALPLDEAGKYVAGAYVVFLTLILVYVAIIGREDRADRAPDGELLELTDEEDADREREPGVLMELLALGVSHKTAPLALRERLALPEGRAAARAGRAARRTRTCTRPWRSRPATAPSSTWWPPTRWRPRAPRWRCWRARRRSARPSCTDQLYSFRDRDAVRHLFSVAAGLDSMIVGEAEIQGQVKRAYELALVEGATGPIANRLFREALGAGKRVRTETGVGRSQRVGVVGGGGAGRRDARRPRPAAGAGDRRRRERRADRQALRERGVQTVFVANRHYDRAIGLAQRFGGSAVRFEDLPDELDRADIVVSCTASPHQIVGREELELTMSGRAGGRWC